MKTTFFMLIFSLFLFNNVFAKTLVKYQKTTGNILQTSSVNEMPSSEILADRFKSAETDVILVDESVDISKQRVDLEKKVIINIPQKELDDVKKVNDEINVEKALIEKEKENAAIQSLKARGQSLKHFKE